MDNTAAEQLWQAVTTKNTQALIEQLRAAPAVPTAPVVRKIVWEKSPDRCAYCEARDHYGAFTLICREGLDEYLVCPDCQ